MRSDQRKKTNQTLASHRLVALLAHTVVMIKFHKIITMTSWDTSFGQASDIWCFYLQYQPAVHSTEEMQRRAAAVLWMEYQTAYEDRKWADHDHDICFWYLLLDRDKKTGMFSPTAALWLYIMKQWTVAVCSLLPVTHIWTHTHLTLTAAAELCQSGSAFSRGFQKRARDAQTQQLITFKSTHNAFDAAAGITWDDAC